MSVQHLLVLLDVGIWYLQTENILYVYSLRNNIFIFLELQFKKYTIFISIDKIHCFHSKFICKVIYLKFIYLNWLLYMRVYTSIAVYSMKIWRVKKICDPIWFIIVVGFILRSTSLFKWIIGLTTNEILILWKKDCFWYAWSLDLSIGFFHYGISCEKFKKMNSYSFIIFFEILTSRFDIIFDKLK